MDYEIIDASALARELCLTRATIIHRMNHLDIRHVFMGRRICRTAEESDRVRNFRKIYRQGLKQK